MGKQSRRTRTSVGKQQPSQSALVHSFLHAAPDAEDPDTSEHTVRCGTVDVRVPPLIPNWTAHAHAVAHLTEFGWQNVEQTPTFSSADVLAALVDEQRRHGLAHLQFVDLTPHIPVDPGARHDLVIQLSNGWQREFSAAQPHRAAFYFRSAENTPAILGGFTRAHILQYKGADAARSVIRTLPTPAAQLFHRGVTYSFPSIFTQHSALFVARILLQLFSDDAYEETCTACRRPLYTHDGSGTIQVREFVPTPCKHGMHLSCRHTLEEHCQAYGLAPHCLQCTELLPPYTVPPLHADVVSTPSLKV